MTTRQGFAVEVTHKPRREKITNLIHENISHLISEYGTVYVRRSLIAAFPAWVVRECRTKKHNFVAHTWDELGNMIAIDRVGRFVQLFPHEPGYVR